MSNLRSKIRLPWLLLAVLLLGLALWLVPQIPSRYRSTPDVHRAEAGPAATAASARTADRIQGTAPATAAPSVPPQAAGASRAGEEHLIRLVARSIDTSVRSEAGAPAADAAQAFAGSTAGAWIVQFRGPVHEADKQRIAAAGARLCGYIPNNAFAVRMDAATISRVAALSFVQWIGPYKPDYKIQPALAARQSGIVTVDINAFTPEEAVEIARQLAALGATNIEQASSARFGRVRADIAVRAVPDLAALDAVQWIEEHLPAKLFNNRALEGPRLNVTNVWTAHGLTGSNQVIALADTGLDTGDLSTLHTDFAGRVKNVYALGRPGTWSDPHGHGTHTSGSALGDGTASAGKYRGVAWRAQLVMQSILDNFGGLGGLPSNLNELFLQAYTNGARVHSDSWGTSAAGFYTSEARDVDEFTWDHQDMLVCIAAGNDGADTDANGVVNPDSMGSPAVAKNALTVGGSENFHNGGEASGFIYGFFSGFPATPLRFDSVSMPFDGVHQGLMGFSSRGPCDDGRIKPDLVAPGTDVISTKSSIGGSGWGIAPDNSKYMIDGGTSMSTPLAAGCAALARQYFIERAGATNPSASLLKATLINGARSLRPGQYGTGGNLEIPAGPRPNSAEGWGQISLEDTLFPAAPSSLAFFDRDALVTGATNTYVLNLGGTNSFHATLCWPDFPATPGSSKNLINDLDLAVIGPDGVTNHASAMGAPDRTNNVEGLDLAAPAPGIWRIEVRGFNVPNGPQNYALVLRGPLAPVIVHTPLANTTNTVDAYAVDAVITSAIPVDTNQLFVLWGTGASTNFTSAPLALLSNGLYRGYIPAQPQHTTIRYYLTAATNGLVATDPAGAPAAFHAFLVTTPVTLAVTGTPLFVGAVAPPYGLNTFASGNTVRASAPSFAWTTNFAGYVCTGWTGSGSVPILGNSNAVAFPCLENSKLTWHWRFDSYGLVQSSTPPGIVSTTTWWSAGSQAQTVVAPPSALVTGTTFRFTGWYLDGSRMPDAVSVAANPAAGFTMARAHLANAAYLPENQDANTNGLADWWEQLYFGSTAHTPGGDPDFDGFNNAQEFADRTNPRSAASVPAPPVIVHAPLADPQAHPAPFAVQAVVTDNFTVAAATLNWRRNGGAWTGTVMTAGASNVFSASIPPQGVGGDAFLYAITAADPAGHTATNGPHAFSVAYPLMVVSPPDLGTNLVETGSTGTVSLVISNAGVGALSWTARVVKIDLREDVEGGTNGWSHGGQNDQWHQSSYRSHGGSNAWYMGSDVTHVYLDATDSRLLLPPLHPGSNAVLRFWQWFSSEYDNGLYFWDGGIVEASTNGGATFFTIDPVGGYPYLITPNPDSPFPAGMPCLAGFGGWEQVAFDLSAFADRDLRLRFRFGSDFYTVAEGWYVDDLEIVSDMLATDWFAMQAPAGTVPAAAASHIACSLNAAVATNGGLHRALVRVEGNDTLTPTGLVSVTMRVDARPRAAITYAMQSPADGSGTVAITNSLFDADGGPLALRAEFSTDGGAAWYGLYVSSATAAVGAVTLSGASTQQVSGIAVSPSNAVTIRWPSTNPPAIAFLSNVLVRITPTDGWLDGHAVTSAPFAVDNVAPSASNAVVTLSASAFGNYFVGPVLTSSWSGFTDIGVGITNYLIATDHGSGTTNGDVAAGSPALLGGLAPNATNVVFVRARDAAGNIGPAASASRLVLDPSGDLDADGYNNAAEEIAGTAATDASSVLHITGASPESEGLVIRWPFVSNRIYSLQMLSNFFDPPFLVMTNPPVVVTNHTAVFSITNAPSLPGQHFRLGVQPAP